MIDIDQAALIAEYRSHLHEYPEFIHGELSENGQAAAASSGKSYRKGSAVTQARVSVLPVAQHRAQSRAVLL